MPLYQYEHETTGEKLEMVRPYPLRDLGVPEGFKRVPSAPGVLVKYRGSPSLAQNVLRGYYEAEQRDGTRFKSGFTKKEIAAAWSE